MSRLDRHVSTVQTKLFLGRFLAALAWSTLVIAGLVLLAVVVNLFFRIFVDYLPNFPVKWTLIGCAIGCVAFAVVWAIVRRETRAQAAAAIDDRLGLKEKFSTAIYVRPSNDPFAMAAVQDAERTADSLQFVGHFPVRFPRPAYYSVMLAAAAFLLATYVQPLNLFAHEIDPLKKVETPLAHDQAKQNVDRALAAVASMPKSSEQSDDFRKLVAELHDLAKAPKLDDPARANRRALQALQEVTDQAQKEYDRVRKYADSQNLMMQALQPPDDAKGPVSDARREMVKGNFEEAAKKLEEAAKNFDKMTKEQKEDAAKQMAQAAAQLDKLANNPQLQEQVKDQLQQMGASPDEAKKMQDLMQKAAQGGKAGQDAAKQAAQMAKDITQQMNNGKGPNAQQQQQIQQAIQQIQGQANAQNQANGLSQAAAKMAQAMQQQAGGQQGQPGQGQQGQGQQGANGQNNPQGAGQMAQAQADMKQALQNMGAIKQDLQNMARNADQAQQAMQQGQQAANGQQQAGAQGGQGQQPGQGQQAGGGKGEFAQGQVPPGQGNGQGGPGIGNGGGIGKSATPFNVKPEQSPSEDNEKGKVLASYFVKDKADPGEQKMMMQKMVATAQKEAPDEVDAEHASRQAQKVAQEYFRTMAQDAPAPKK